jgi:hypothetical protein
MLTGKKAAINANLTKFIDQDGPPFVRWLGLQQMNNRGCFSNTKKAGNDVGWHS